MTKRRLDDNGFVNVLRQKHKEDPILKQQTGKITCSFYYACYLDHLAQNTFALLMKAQRQTNAMDCVDLSTCYKCNKNRIQDKCAFCEHSLCHECLQQCLSCQHLYCSTCSVIE